MRIGGAGHRSAGMAGAPGRSLSRTGRPPGPSASPRPASRAGRRPVSLRGGPRGAWPAGNSSRGWRGARLTAVGGAPRRGLQGARHSRCDAGSAGSSAPAEACLGGAPRDLRGGSAYRGRRGGPEQNPDPSGASGGPFRRGRAARPGAAPHRGAASLPPPRSAPACGRGPPRAEVLARPGSDAQEAPPAGFRSLDPAPWCPGLPANAGGSL